MSENAPSRADSGKVQRPPAGHVVLPPAASSLETRPVRPGNTAGAVRSPDVTHVHQVVILDGLRTPDRLPDSIVRSQRAVCAVHPEARYRLWNGEELRDFLRGAFDGDVLHAFDTLTSYAFKCDLARLCLLQEFGGLYLDLGVRMLTAWDLPADCAFAAFRDIPFVGQNWATMQTGLLWAKPGQPETECAIRFIVENCRERYYGSTPLHPTGPVLLGKAVVAAMAQREVAGGRVEIGACHRLTPETGMQNITYVSRGGKTVALRTKLIPGDLTHIGIVGGNDYNRIWRMRQVYGERQRTWHYREFTSVRDDLRQDEDGLHVEGGSTQVVAWGPYATLARGAYEATLTFSAVAVASPVRVTICSHGGTRVAARRRARVADGPAPSEVRVRFVLDEDVDDLECQLRVPGDFRGVLSHLTIRSRRDGEPGPAARGWASAARRLPRWLSRIGFGSRAAK